MYPITKGLLEAFQPRVFGRLFLNTARLRDRFNRYLL